MASLQPPGLLTIDDLDDFPDDGNRYELIDGELLVSPTPAVRHQWLSANLFTALARHAPDQLAVMFAPVGVELGHDTHVEPDLLVVPKTAMGGRKLDGRPVLVVEILSPSSRRTDAVRKRRVYERMGIPSYWIADPEAPSLTVLELVGDEYREVASAEGAETLRVEVPYPLTLVPEDLVAL